MNPLILAFAGRIASGKSTVAHQVSKAFDWPYVSFGEYIRVEARRRGLEETRENLQLLGDQFIASGWEQFCKLVLSQANWNLGMSLVVDGIRHADGLEVLRNITAPQPVLLVFVDVPENIRTVRLNNRGIKWEQQQQQDLHNSELQVRNALPQIANLIIDGTDPVTSLVNRISLWLNSLTD